MNIKLTFPLLLLFSLDALAGGYRVALQGQKALGMGHTGVAMSESAETVFFNPAGMSLLSQESIVAGITLISGDTKYQNTATATAAETDNPIGTPINFYYSNKYDDKLTYGLGVYTPYGNRVEWPTDWAGSHLVNQIELAAIFIQPTLSYDLGDGMSIGGGPALIIGSVEFNRNLSTSLTDASGNRSNVTISADNVTAFGFNIGFMKKVNDKFNFGINYRTEVELEAENEPADFSNIPSSLAVAFTDTTFNANLVLPAELTIGMSYEVDDKTTVAFDINRTYWSAYENLDVNFNDTTATPIDTSFTSSNPRNWQDANIFRVGVQHVLDETMTVRGGFYYDESPIQDGYFAPETPRNDSRGFTGGLTYNLDKNLSLDFSVLVLVFNEFTGSYDFYVEPNATSPSPFGGQYKASVTTLGFGVDYTF